jgi:hypothetical protein
MPRPTCLGIKGTDLEAGPARIPRNNRAVRSIGTSAVLLVGSLAREVPEPAFLGLVNDLNRDPRK